MGAAQQFENRIHLPRYGETPRSSQHHSSSRLGRFHAAEVDGCSLAGLCPLHRSAMHLESAHAYPSLGWIQFEFVVESDTACDQRPRYDQSVFLNRKTAVDWQARMARYILACDQCSSAL